MKTITEITRQKPTPPQIRLAAYCRVSSDSSDQLHSFAAQIKYYSEYCKRHSEYKFVDIYIGQIIKGCYKKKSAGKLSTSDKIDKVVTNRFAALPIFAVVMFLVYYALKFGTKLLSVSLNVFVRKKYIRVITNETV